ncbi:MAG: nucleoside-diphosphate kinase [Thermoleophilia bacterium]|nr:nucleoside-diphosphate kinase [Thermoleophilia bacterium]
MESNKPIERTLVLVKPSGVARGLIGEVISRMERRGLTIKVARLIMVTREMAERHYQEHKGKDFYEELVAHITSGPVFAMVVEGPSAVNVVRRMAGATNPLEAAPGTIRGDYGLDIRRNVVHASDSIASAEREIAIFFPEGTELSPDSF